MRISEFVNSPLIEIQLRDFLLAKGHKKLIDTLIEDEKTNLNTDTVYLIYPIIEKFLITRYGIFIEHNMSEFAIYKGMPETLRNASIVKAVKFNIENRDSIQNSYACMIKELLNLDLADLFN